MKVIKNKAQYQGAMSRFEELKGAEPGTAEFEELELLIVLIEQYEKEKFKLPLPDPIALLHSMIEDGPLRGNRDLVPFIGAASVVSQVLSRKRPLTLEMVRKLHEGLHIPLEILIQPTVEKGYSSKQRKAS